jgi:phosphoglycolate phosphatase
MKHTVILFDLDGTLIDSTEAIVESFAAAYAAMGGTPPPTEAIKTLIGLPLDTMFARLGISADNVDRYVAAYKAHYRTVHTAKTTLLPHVREAIETAAAFAYLGIVTTKTSRYSVELMEHFNLMRFFGILVGKDDVTHPKPHPEPIRKALRALPSVTGGAYMIGDTCLDLDAAHAAGIDGMGVLCGYGTADRLRSCGDELFRNAAEAVEAIADRERK